MIDGSSLKVSMLIRHSYSKLIGFKYISFQQTKCILNLVDWMITLSSSSFSFSWKEISQRLEIICCKFEIPIKRKQRSDSNLKHNQDEIHKKLKKRKRIYSRDIIKMSELCPWICIVIVTYMQIVIVYFCLLDCLLNWNYLIEWD